MATKKEGSEYVLTLTGNGVSVKRPISESIARRILNLVLESNIGIATINREISGEVMHVESDGQQGDTPTPKAFMAQKRPATDMERVTCLAYYLTRYRNSTPFRTAELTKLNTEASQPRLSNPTAAARNAVGQDYLSLAGGGKKQITVRGEALVEALPDRTKVKEALASNSLRHHRRKIKRTAKKPKDKE